MKKWTFLLFFFIVTTAAYACITCNKKIQEAIHQNFYPNLFIMLSAFIVLAAIVALLAYSSTKKHNAKRLANSGTALLNPVPLTTAATVLGIGIGGFIDGIVLHQILQWHEMLSNKLPPVDLISKSVNMFWDGIFHLFTLIVVITGIVLLYKLLHRNDIDRSSHFLMGGLLLGWGLFNIVEGVIDHHILKLHNVREITDYKAFWNWGFLGFSVVVLVIGYAILNKNQNYKKD